MTNILRRADRPREVAELGRLSARRLTARRAGLTDGTPPAERLEAARRLGLSALEASLITDDRPLAPGDLLSVTGALARLQPGASRAALQKPR
jgi:hypothetical protein